MTRTASNFTRVTSRFLCCFLALILIAQFEFGTSQELSIKDPTFQWDGFRLNIDYEISGSIAAEQVTYDLVSDKDCEGGIIDKAEIESELIEVSDTSVRISLLMNAQNIHAARYVTHHDTYAIVGICSRLWINKPTGTYEPVTATRDDYILIQAELEDLEGVIEILPDKAKRWGFNVFRCDQSNQRIDSPPAIRNGEKLRLCVKLTQRTKNDGVYFGTLKSFHFERDGVIQKSVETYGTDEATNVFDCDRGSEQCVIETVLNNDFFHSPGEVKAEGVVFLQWGDENDRRELQEPQQQHRSLRTVEVNLQQRSLYEWYEKGEIVSEKEGKVMITIAPMEKVYKAEAFSCDSTDKPNKMKSLNETDRVKICIKPNEEAIEAGVFINTLESFSFGLANDDKSQKAIDSYGRVIDGSKTKVDCSVGASLCSIDSTVDDWFFDEYGTMVVTGYAVLQFGSRRRRAQISLDGLAFAGRDQVEAYFDTIGRDGENKKGSLQNWFEGLFDDYDMSATSLTVLYIVAVVLIVLICLCCCAGFIFFFWYGSGSRKEEPKGGRVQHVDIKINQQGKDVSSFADERTRNGSQSNAREDDIYGNDPEYPTSPKRSRRRNSNNATRRNSNNSSRRNSNNSDSY